MSLEFTGNIYSIDAKKFPMELEVLPADDPVRLKLGFTVWEEKAECWCYLGNNFWIKGNDNDKGFTYYYGSHGSIVPCTEGQYKEARGKIKDGWNILD